MYRFIIDSTVPLHLFKELIDIFLLPDEYECYSSEQLKENLPGKPEIEVEDSNIYYYHFPDAIDQRNEIKRALYQDLSDRTGKVPEWGILTGIRPVKLAGEMMEQGKSPEEVSKILKEKYLVHPDKALLVIEMYRYQIQSIGKPASDLVSLYIGIPFCPTRCLYCSFPSNQGKEADIANYLEALKNEIRFVGAEMKRVGIYPESLYLGGGTPTTLNAAQLEDLMMTWEESVDLSRCREITVEAGRPDTMTDEKIELLHAHRVTRISINPQTMKDSTLKNIGRNHTADEIREAFLCARKAGIPAINADIIAGLPGETLLDFRETLFQLLALKPENITIHPLAVKRASRLIEVDSQFHHRQGLMVKEMLKEGHLLLEEKGYAPYYLYRQKHMAGAQENIGFSKKNHENIYNIRMMDEHQTIIALGAGAISKVYYPRENRLERVANVSNYELYIQRIEEMIQRKRINLFQEVETHADQRT